MNITLDGIIGWLTSANAFATIFVIAILVIILVLLKKYSAKKNQDKSLSGEKAAYTRVFNDILRALIIFIAVLVIFEINGINITSMIAGLGIASAIVGLALQDWIKDIITGARIMSDHYFTIGDCVLYKDREYIVSAFNMKDTKLCDIDTANIISVSNRNFSEVCKVSKRLDIDVPISYNQDTEALKKVMTAIAEKIAQFDKVFACDYLGIHAFDKSSVLYRIRINCAHSERAKVRRKALNLIFEEFNTANITIPFEQLDVHIEQVNE